MFKRLVSALALLLLVVSATVFIVTPSAEAEVNCDLVLDPFVERDAGFNPFFMRDTVSASELLAFAGSIDAAIADANAVLGLTNLPPGVRPFYEQALVWFAFTERGDCAASVAYPGPFENIPPGPVAAHGFSLNPTAASPASSFSDSAPATAVAVPVGATLAHTGSETDALLFLGAGLVGFGALALGSRRRYL